MDDYEYDYFMVRVRRLPAGTGSSSDTAETGVSGVAERLDTGEKHVFRSGAELLEVMLGGIASAKLPRASHSRNDLSDAAPGR